MTAPFLRNPSRTHPELNSMFWCVSNMVAFTLILSSRQIRRSFKQVLSGHEPCGCFQVNSSTDLAQPQQRLAATRTYEDYENGLLGGCLDVLAPFCLGFAWSRSCSFSTLPVSSCFSSSGAGVLQPLCGAPLYSCFLCCQSCMPGPDVCGEPRQRGHHRLPFPHRDPV